MSSFTEPAPTDPADMPWIKVSVDVISDAVTMLRWLQETSDKPALIKEIAYVRHRLEMAANSQMQPALWNKPSVEVLEKEEAGRIERMNAYYAALAWAKPLATE